MNKKYFLITMAGLGSRFLKEGYTCPKYEIKLSTGKTLFYYSMLSLLSLINENDEFIFLTRKENNAIDFIIKEIKDNFNDDIYVKIKYPTILLYNALLKMSIAF